MKKFLVMMMLCFCMFLLGGCQNNENRTDDIKMWDCGAYSENKSEIKYFDNVDITPTKGFLTFEIIMNLMLRYIYMKEMKMYFLQR